MTMKTFLLVFPAVVASCPLVGCPLVVDNPNASIRMCALEKRCDESNRHLFEGHTTMLVVRPHPERKGGWIDSPTNWPWIGSTEFGGCKYYASANDQPTEVACLSLGGSFLHVEWESVWYP